MVSEEQPLHKIDDAVIKTVDWASEPTPLNLPNLFDSVNLSFLWGKKFVK